MTAAQRQAIIAQSLARGRTMAEAQRVADIQASFNTGKRQQGRFARVSDYMTKGVKPKVYRAF